MERPTLLPFPNAWREEIENDLAEIDTAIALVARGFATRVSLVGLMDPDAAAATGLAHAQQANVAFSIHRSDGDAAVIVGPRN